MKKTKRTEPKINKETVEGHRAFRESQNYHPAFRRFHIDSKPMIEYPPINHPRGKDGAWGH